MNASDVVLVDPDLLEEQLQTGSLTLTVNIDNEICSISKAGGSPISTQKLIECVDIAKHRGAELNAEIRRALQAAQNKQKCK